MSRWLPNNTTTNSTGSGFLDPSDITDSIVQEFVANKDPRVAVWLDYTDGEVLALAQEKEVQIQSISMPLHIKILEYAKAYFCWVVFFDTLGRMQDYGEANIEMLKLKLDVYSRRCQSLRQQVTREMFYYANQSLLASQRFTNGIQLIRQ